MIDNREAPDHATRPGAGAPHNTAGRVSRAGWLRHEPAAAATHLVCLPHAGAGASSFTRWLGLFPATISAVRVQLPGREDAAGQPPLRRVQEAVDGLLPQLRHLHPIALYGHSMGALVAFELARAMESAGTPPVHLFVSGRRAPYLPARRVPIHHLPQHEFAAALNAMGMGGTTQGSAAFLRYALPLIQADLELSEEYEFRPQPRLRCPVTAFYGTEDPVVDADQVEAWRAVTTGSFALHTFAGDHFFHQRNRVSIVATMASALEYGAGRGRPAG